MRLSKVEIRNYRSIKQLDLDIEDGYTVFVGANNAGKSNVLRAIEFALTPSIKLNAEDVCAFYRTIGDVSVVLHLRTYRQQRRLCGVIVFCRMGRSESLARAHAGKRAFLRPLRSTHGAVNRRGPTPGFG